MKVIESKLLIIFLVIMGTLIFLSIPDDAKMGEIYFKSYKVDEAFDYYKKAEGKGERSVSILRKFKDYYLVQGNIALALEVQVELVTALPKSQKELTELKNLYSWNGKVYESLQTNEKIAMLQKDSKIKNSMLLDLSDGYRWIRKYDDLERVSNFLVSVNAPDSIRPRLDFYISTSQYQKIIDLTHQLEREAELSQELLLIQAQSYELLGKYEAAIDSYQKYMFGKSLLSFEIEVPDRGFYAKNLGIYEKIIELLERMDNQTRLISLFQNIIKVDSQNYEIAFTLSERYALAGQVNNQKKILEQMYLSNNPNVLYRAGDMFRGLGEIEIAIRFLKKLTKLRPNSVIYNRLIAEVFEENLQFQEALKSRYKIRKLLEAKIPKTTKVYPLFWTSSIVASAEFNGGNNKIKNDIRENHKNIIYLLERLSFSNELTKELELYNSRYPNDLEMKKYLAQRYNNKGDSSNAKKLYNDIYDQNYLEREAAIYLIDEYIKKNSYEDALKVLNRFPEDDVDYDFLNRRYSIYEAINPKKAETICRNIRGHKATSSTDYSFVDLKARCLEKDKDVNSAVELYLSYINTNPDDIYPKISLGYLYVRNERMAEANLVITTLKRISTDKDIILLEDYYIEMINNIKKRNAIEVASFYEYFLRANDKKKYTQYHLEVLKNFDKHAFGVDLGIQDPIFPSSYIGDLGLIYRFSKSANIYRFEFGKNFINDDGLKAKSSWIHNIALNSSFSLELSINQQVFEIVNLNDKLGATKDSIIATYYKNNPFESELFFTFQLSDFYVENRSRSAKYWEGAVQYDFSLNQLFSLGPYIYVLREREYNKFPEGILVDSVTVLAAHLRYDHTLKIKAKNLSNITDLYIGSDLENESGGLNYFSITNRTVYQLNPVNSFEFEIQAAKQIQVDEDDTVYRAKLTYNYWYY